MQRTPDASFFKILLTLISLFLKDASCAMKLVQGSASYSRDLPKGAESFDCSAYLRTCILPSARRHWWRIGSRPLRSENLMVEENFLSGPSAMDVLQPGIETACSK